MSSLAVFLGRLGSRSSGSLQPLMSAKHPVAGIRQNGCLLRAKRIEFVRGCHSGKSQERNAVQNYIQKVLNNPLPIGAGALVVGILQWKRIKARNEAAEVGSDGSESQGKTTF